MKSPLSIFLGLVFVLLVCSPVAAASYTWKNLYDHPVLNQIGNNPEIGDETHFLKIRDIHSAAGQKSLSVRPGQTLALTAYFDNGASQADMAAKNVRLKVIVPTVKAKKFTVVATLSAANTDPQKISDTVTLTSDVPVLIGAESGSVRLWNNVLRGHAISDETYKSGTLLGYDKLDGVVPGGPAYSGYVTMKLKVTGATTVPNTGPGDVLGIFAGASAAGTAFHLVRTARRRS